MTVNTESFRQRNERNATIRSTEILKLAAVRGVTPADTFIALCAVIGRQNPYMTRKVLDALELSIRRREVVAMPSTENKAGAA